MLNTSKKKIILFVFIILTLIILYQSKNLIDIDSIIQKNEQIIKFINNHFLFAALLATAIIILGIVFILPLTPMVLISGFYFGMINSIFICFFAEFIGAIIVYTYSRYLINDFLNTKLSIKLINIGLKFNKNGFYYLVLLRVIGGIPFTIVSILSGMIKMPFKIYSIATLVGILPYIYIYSSIGSKFNEIVELKMFSIKMLLSLEYLAPIILLLSIIFIPKIYNMITRT